MVYKHSRLRVLSAWSSFAGAGIALYGEQGKGESYQAHITSYDYDCMVSEAGQYGQPGTGGPNKYQVSPITPLRTLWPLLRFAGQ